MSPSGETHYVLVVHGTWNPPREGERLWYQLDDADSENFCGQLNTRLAEYGLGGAVWRHCNGESTEFGWSGANHHVDRIVAAKALAKRMVEITTADPTARIHLIAHSHGGNVALAAIQLYLTYLLFQAEIVWNADDRAHASSGSGFAEGPEDVLTPLHLPPVEASARAFGLGNEDLLLKRWLATREEYRADTETSGSPAENDFKTWWARSASHNRLGRLVFLGTPFLYKRWGSGDERSSWFSARWVNFSIDSAVWFSLLLAFAYIAVEAVWLCRGLVLLALHGSMLWPAWNPLHWPVWLNLLWLLPAGAMAASLAAALTTPILETNLYCEDTSIAYLLLNHSVPVKARPVLPLKALVVTAGLLDEVLLLMFSERIINTLIGDHVNRFVFASSEGATHPPTGMLQGLFAPLAGRLAQRLRAAAAFVAYPVVWPAKKLIAAYLRRTLFHLLKTAGYGVEAVELRSARLDVTVTPRLRRIIDDHLWEMTAGLAREPPAAAQADAASRYAFLWDRGEFYERLPKSWLLKQLKPPLDEWTELYGLTLEERVREIVGLVDLSHSHYYSNREVIARIARFIATGDLPPGVG